MLDATVLSYLSTAKGLPFFYIVGDDDYSKILQDLKSQGLEEIRISNYCSALDKFPSIDDLIDGFRTADVDYKTNKYVLVGLGEYLALRGVGEVAKVLRKLKSTTLGGARVVVLLRGVSAQFKEVISDDIKIQSQQRVLFTDVLDVNIKIVNIDSALGLKVDKGIKFLLSKLEAGVTGTVLASTKLSLENSIFSISNISDPYSLIKMKLPMFTIPKEYGTNEQWMKFNEQLSECKYSIEDLLKSHQYNDNYEIDIYEKVNGFEYKNWLYFIALKYNVKKIGNSYLRYVVETTSKFEDFKKRLLISILDIDHSDSKHKQFYMERKRLVKEFKNEDVAMFIHEASIDRSKIIHNLTDNTISERQVIIDYISQNGIPNDLETIYPALASYLKKYIFSCGPLSEKLTDYFDLYKKQKVKNFVEEEFLEMVNENAERLLYTRLNTRENILNIMSQKKTTLLYWVDALGVEYLSYFTELAKKKGLLIKVDIVRADIPTITMINKTFYDLWDGDKCKESKLDEIKHKDIGAFDFKYSKAPIYLANELEVIESTVGQAAVLLAKHQYDKVVIASDHGASRLAVIYKKEEKYETDTKGEHSGRCCKTFENDLKYAIDENEYTVLADYGRFRGSRSSNVEVHGGASLEEVVIPLITLSLDSSSVREIKLLNRNNIIADAKKGIEVELYITGVSNRDNVKVAVGSSQYFGVFIDSTHYKFELSNIRRSGKYNAEIYVGDSLIGAVEINVKGKTGSVKSDFDDLF